MMRRLAWAIVLALGAFGPAAAQETTTGTLTGAVVDAQGAAVPGANVSISSNQGTKSLVTDNNGRFFAPFLTPGRYAVKVELTGFSSVEQKNIDVRLGQRVELAALTLKVGGLEEVVEVVGSAPVVDTSSTTIGGTLDGDLMKRLPVGRNFTQTLYLVPGVSAADTGAANPSVGGASGLENNYVVDGVNITNTGYGAVGSYSIVFGSLGSGVTTDFIKETQVKTAGFEAEYGQSTGGVVNVVTQSGTNAFHGSVFGYLQPAALEADRTQIQLVNGAINSTEAQAGDYGISMGGPLFKDRLFFYGTFNPQFNRQNFLAPANFPLASLGAVDRKRHTYGYAGKLSYQASSSHRFDLSVFGDPSHGDLGPQRSTSLRGNDTSAFSELKSFGGHNQVLKYDGILTRHWLLEASVARASNEIVEVPSVNQWQVTDTTVSPAVVTGGVGFYEQGNDGTNKQFQLKSTNIVGSHQFRYGASYEDIHYNNRSQYTGPTFTLSDGQHTGTGAVIRVLPDPTFGRIYQVVRATLNPGQETTQQYTNFFLQDTWSIGKKLTFRPGVRYEQQKLVGSDHPATCHQGDSAPGVNDGTGAAMPCEYTFAGNWAPRIGLVFDPTGRGKAKLFANFGRFYAKIPNDLAARALSANAGVRADYFDAALTRPVPDGTQALNSTSHLLLNGTTVSRVDPNAKSTYQDEIVGGTEIEVAHGLSLGLRYTHRNLPRVLEDVGTVSLPAYFTDPTRAGAVNYFITNPTEATQVDLGEGRFESPIHHYDAIELTANKSFSNNWAMLASYRWARLSGTFEGFYRSDNGQSDPAISSLYDFPSNDPSYTRLAPQFGFRGDIRFQGALGQGPLPNDRTHQVKIYGNYTRGPLNLGLGFNAGSGRPLTALASNPVYNNSGEIPETPRGGGIQTRDDGFLTRAPIQMTADLHADYAFKFGGQRRMMLIADVFNVFDRQRPTQYDDGTETTFLAPDPDFGAPSNGNGTVTSSYNLPRQVRLGARFEW